MRLSSDVFCDLCSHGARHVQQKVESWVANLAIFNFFIRISSNLSGKGRKFDFYKLILVRKVGLIQDLFSEFKTFNENLGLYSYLAF